MSKLIRFVGCQRVIFPFRSRSGVLKYTAQNHYGTTTAALLDTESRKKEASDESFHHNDWLDRTRKLLVQRDEKNSIPWSDNDIYNSFVDVSSIHTASWEDELDVTIRYWLARRPQSDNALETSWQLLFDVGIPLWKKSTVDKTNTTLLLRELLNDLLPYWKSFMKPSKTMPYTIAEVWHTLQASDDIPDARTFSIFMSGIGLNVDTTARKKAVNEIDPEDVLEYMIQSPYLHQHPNEFSWNSAFSVWEKRAKNPHRYPDAAKRSKELFDRMISLNHKPDKKSLFKILTVVSNHANSLDGNSLEQIESLFFGQHNKYFSSDAECCEIMIRAYCRFNGVETAFNFLRDMIDKYVAHLRRQGSSSGNADDSIDVSGIPPMPLRTAFRAVILALARRGVNSDRIVMLQRLLQELYVLSDRKVEFDPTNIVLGDIIGKMLVSGRSRDAKLLLDRIFEENAHSFARKGGISSNNHDAIKDNVSFFLPDTRLVNNMIAAFVDSDHRKAPEMAEALFNRWFLNKDANNISGLNLSPNQVSYSYLLKALSKSKQPDAAERCDAILNGMWDAYESFMSDRNERTEDNVIKPVTGCSNAVLNAWALSKHPDAPLRAQSVLDKMHEGYKQYGDNALKPDGFCYGAVLNAWALSSRADDAPLRAQSLLEKIIERYELEGDKAVKSLIKVWYRNVIKAWGFSEHPDAPLRAQALFEELLDQYKRTEDKAFLPDFFCYQAVLNAWSYSNHPDACFRSQSLLEEMMERYKRTEDIAIQPTKVCYKSVMKAWATSTQPDAPFRVQSLFEEYLDRHKESKDKDLKPDSDFYVVAMQAWALSNHPDAGLRVQWLLKDLLDRYESTNDNDFKPTTSAYAFLLKAWANSTTDDAPRRALAIFVEMEDRRIKQLDENANEDLPNEQHYAILIKLFVGRNDVGTAEYLLHHMINRYKGKILLEHRGCFNMVFDAYRTMKHPSADDKFSDLTNVLKRVEFIKRR